jgi:hypothetical protein
MIRSLSRVVALVGLCLVPALAAAQTVSSIAAAPTSVPVGAGTTVKVTVVITDPAVVPSSVVLQRIDEAGGVLATLGTFTDGGTAGEQTTGVHTFTVQTNLLEGSHGLLSEQSVLTFAG